jgi:hypothetical protein
MNAHISAAQMQAINSAAVVFLSLPEWNVCGALLVQLPDTRTASTLVPRISGVEDIRDVGLQIWACALGSD